MAKTKRKPAAKRVTRPPRPHRILLELSPVLNAQLSAVLERKKEEGVPMARVDWIRKAILEKLQRNPDS